MKILLLVMGFSSHQTWAEGYVRASNEHDVRIEVIPGERWKFRMLVAAAELVEKIALNDDMVVVDAMLDVTVLVALLQRDRARHQIPKIFVYMHENQLTTPFTQQDRDQKHQSHWHYGMAHWRSLLAADGFIFNSHTHRRVFAHALPKVLNEQAPRDAAEWHLRRCKELLESHCVILPYGLELEALVSFSTKSERSSNSVPTILWNARLEEDKDPATFFTILRQCKRRWQQASSKLSFQLIILGNDPSKDQVWYQQIRDEFSDQLLFLGWCQDRQEYSSWLRQSSIVLSTAKHETFGISVVESVYMGAIPLLPNRLSYPELFSPRDFPNLLYNGTPDAVDKLLSLLTLYDQDPVSFQQLQRSAKDSIACYDWSKMASAYDNFFWDLARGESLEAIGAKVDSAMNSSASQAHVTTEFPITKNSTEAIVESSLNEPILISRADDMRVQLFRPKSLRNHKEYNKQLMSLRKQGMEPALHGGRRAMVRMLEAISMGSRVYPISFLTNHDLSKVLLTSGLDCSKVPLYVAENQELLNQIRGQKLNAGDSILAMIDFPVPSELDEILANPPILILEDVRNAENVGSILRTAFCLGITSVIASPTAWASLRDTRAARCSMGTMYYHRFYKATSLEETIREIQAGGIAVYGVEIGERAKPVGPHGKDRRWAAVMGNEDLGLTDRVGACCDHIAFVPQAHGDSLNVGHAAAITLFELGREGPIPIHDGKASCM